MRFHNVEFVKGGTKPAHYPPPDRAEIAFAGRSNVGKSSLLNTLLRRKKIARVSRTPGRTQEINFFAVDDFLYLVDLPGYGWAKVSKTQRKSWGTMISSYLRVRENLAAVVVLLDIRREPNPDDHQLLAALDAAEVPTIPVITKCDKLSRSQQFKRLRKISAETGIPVPSLIGFSSVTGAGRDDLWATIEHVITPGDEEVALADDDDGELEPGSEL